MAGSAATHAAVRTYGGPARVRTQLPGGAGLHPEQLLTAQQSHSGLAPHAHTKHTLRIRDLRVIPWTATLPPPPPLTAVPLPHREHPVEVPQRPHRRPHHTVR